MQIFFAYNILGTAREMSSCTLVYGKCRTVCLIVATPPSLSQQGSMPIFKRSKCQIPKLYLTQEFEVLTTPLDVCMSREGLASFLVAQVIDKKGEFHHPAS
jgi:hypothetical protein